MPRSGFGSARSPGIFSSVPAFLSSECRAQGHRVLGFPAMSSGLTAKQAERGRSPGREAELPVSRGQLRRGTGGRRAPVCTRECGLRETGQTAVALPTARDVETVKDQGLALRSQALCRPPGPLPSLSCLPPSWTLSLRERQQQTCPAQGPWDWLSHPALRLPDSSALLTLRPRDHRAGLQALAGG